MSVFSFLSKPFVSFGPFAYFIPNFTRFAIVPTKVTGASSSWKRISDNKTAVLYAYTAPIPIKSKRTGPMFKIGKTVNLKSRQRSYKTLYPSGSVYYSVPCSSIHHAERILHDVLKMNGHHIDREIFEIEGEILKEYMNVVVKFTEKMKKVKTSRDVKRILT